VTVLKGLVVGVGALGRHHARILSSMDGVSLVAVADSNRTNGENVANACGSKWVSDYREVLTEVDFAVVAVPTMAHEPVATTLLESGIDVFVEKPLAMNSAEARNLVAMAESHSRVLQVGHIERFNPAFEATLPHLCDVKYMRAERVSPYSFRSTDISVVLDMMIHDIDLVLAITGETPSRVDAMGVTVFGDQADIAQARLVFSSGCVADLVASRISPVTNRCLQTWSSSGCTQIDFGARKATSWSPTPTLLYGTSPLDRSRQPDCNIEQLKASVFGQYIQPTDIPVVAQDQLSAELANFQQAIRSRGIPRVDGRQGLAALEVAEMIAESIQSHQWDGSDSGRVGPMVFKQDHQQLRRAG